MGSVMAFIKSKNKGKTLIVDLPDIALITLTMEKNFTLNASVK